MNATIYIYRDSDMIHTGQQARAMLTEPNVSRTWIRRVVVQLPDGYEIAWNKYGEPMMFRGSEAVPLSTNSQEEPVIIDPDDNGKHILLPIISEGWT